MMSHKKIFLRFKSIFCLTEDSQGQLWGKNQFTRSQLSLCLSAFPKRKWNSSTIWSRLRNTRRPITPVHSWAAWVVFWASNRQISLARLPHPESPSCGGVPAPPSLASPFISTLRMFRCPARPGTPTWPRMPSHPCLYTKDLDSTVALRHPSTASLHSFPAQDRDERTATAPAP